MKTAAKPTDEFERLKSLHRLKVLDTVPEKQFDQLTLLASYICQTPIALISLVDGSRQWFKSKRGLGAEETSRDISFCAHAIRQDRIFIVSDALNDDRFFDNPLVTGEPKIQFYAGVPLVTSEGAKIGTLCVLDHVPKQLSSDQIVALSALADQVINQLELRSLLLETQKSEAQAKDEKLAANSATEAKSSFLANMSHEIRTPMNGIIGMAQLLLDSDLTSDQKEKVSILQNCGQALLILINDVLDFSKLEAEKMEFEHIPFSLHDLASETVELFKPLVAKKNLKISYEVEKDVPAGLTGDAGRLRQILYNLVCNSAKFTQHGEIKVLVSAHPPRSTGEYEIQVAISDTGIGMSKDTQEKLFKSFSQADASTTRRFGGTGLGLAISKGLCEKMGGRIWVQSEERKGSTFFFTFLSEPVSLEDIQKLKVEKAALNASGQLLAPHLKILVAEDNQVNQKVVCAFLKKLGYEADLASDGKEALRLVEQNAYHCILMDCHMPNMDGFEATRQIIKSLPAASRPKIIALTASALAEDQVKCFEAGMDDFLTKPLRCVELEGALARFFAIAPICATTS